MDLFTELRKKEQEAAEAIKIKSLMAEFKVFDIIGINSCVATPIGHEQSYCAGEIGYISKIFKDGTAHIKLLLFREWIGDVRRNELCMFKVKLTEIHKVDIETGPGSYGNLKLEIEKYLSKEKK